MAALLRLHWLLRWLGVFLLEDSPEPIRMEQNTSEVVVPEMPGGSGAWDPHFYQARATSYEVKLWKVPARCCGRDHLTHTGTYGNA